MDTLQQDLNAAHPILDIDIVGINEIGHDSANSLMTADRSLPWLQDVDANGNQSSDVWSDLWNVTYRDVVILDGSNSVVETYNLTENNLADSEDYASLRTKLIDAAMAEQKPWQNQANQYDINNDGFVVPLDVLFQINSINDEGARQLAAPTGIEVPAYYDCNGDGWLSSIDALQVINYMDEVKAAGEGSPTEDSLPTQFSLPQAFTAPTDSAGDETDSTVALTSQSEANSTVRVLPTDASAGVSAVNNEPLSATESDEFWAAYWGTPASLLEHNT